MNARASDFAVRSLVVAGTLVLCLLLLEAGLRVIGRFRTSGISGYLQEGGLSYRLRENATKHIYWPTLQFTVYTDEHGFRYRRPGPRPIEQTPYLAVIGSSEVFGNGLDYDDTFVGLLSRHFESNGVDLANLAVPGHHFLEQAELFRQFASKCPRSPTAVLICLNPLLIGGYDDVHPNVTVKMGELFPRHKWQLPLARLALANLSASYTFVRDSIRKLQVRHLKTKDYDLGFYIERYSKTHRIRNPEVSAAFLRHLDELETFIRSHHAIPICVYAPAVGGFQLNKLASEGKLDPQLFDTAFFPELVRAHCSKTSIPFLDLEPLLQRRYDTGEKLNFDLDAHFNGPTSALIGEFLARSIEPILARPPF